MFCQQCGAEMAEGAIFCTKCGTKAIQVKPSPMPASAATGNGMQQNVGGSNPYVQPNQITYNGTGSDKKYYGDNIKPYYRAEFDKIALGQKPKFNWAAFFLGPYNQLYNGCTQLFCKTFLLTQTVVIIIALINVLASLKFDFGLMSIASGLMGLCSLVQLGLQVINGMRFNEWFYQDVMENPSKKRTKKCLWVFSICQIAAIVLLNLISIIFKPSYEDLFGDLSDYESSYEEDNQMEQNQTKPSTATGPRKFAIDGDERRPMFQQFSALLYQYVDFSGMSDEEIQSYLEHAYTQWLSGEAYTEIVFDENYELTIQDIDVNDEKISDKNIYSGEIIYDNIPLSALISTSTSEIIADLGIPILYDEYKLVYDDIEFDLNGDVITRAESYSPEKYTVDGEDLEKNRIGLIKILGEPSDEGYIGDGYSMTYHFPTYSVSFELGDIDSEAWRICVLMPDNEQSNYIYDNNQDNVYQNFDDLSSFPENSLYLFSGNYESNGGTSISVNIYSSFDEGNTVGNIFLYDALGHETYAEIRDDNAGEGIYILCFEDGSVMYIEFYQDSTGAYYADIQGLDAIYTNVDQIETYIMTEQYIS